MEMEPETLPLWYDMVKAIKSHIKYSHSVKKIVSDIKVTDIFCDLHHDAVVFWSQLPPTGKKNPTRVWVTLTKHF